MTIPAPDHLPWPTDVDPRVEALVTEVIGRVADKWTMLILDVLAERGGLRFTQVGRGVPGISAKMLSQTLRQLERGVLGAWTLVMFVWMIAVRLPAMKAAGIDMTKLKGGKGSDADGVLPAQAQWKAHNYNHLLEQPTCFYAVSFVIAFTGTGDGMNAW